MPKFIDLTNQKFNQLTVLYKDIKKSKQTKKSYWVCQCDCGNIKSIYANNLKTGHTQSCGCFQKKQTSKANFEDLTGQKFGLLTVITRDENANNGAVKWKCQCKCGNYISVWANNLKSGKNYSCGCLKTSIGEKQIEDILKENNISYIKEYTVKEIGYLRYDFYLPEFNRLIEFDGEQHYQECSGNWNKISLKERQEKDKIKNLYAISQNIDLIRIPYFERGNIDIDLLLNDKYLINK